MRDNTVTYTLTTPGGTVTLDHQTDVYVEKCEFNATVDAPISRRGQQHGGWFDSARKEHGTWSVDIRVRGEGATLETNRVTLARAINSLMDGAGELAWVNQGAATPLRLDDVFLAEDPDWQIEGSSWIVQVMLGTEKPFAEDLDPTTTDSAALTVGGGGFVVPLTIPITFTASSGGDLTLANAGDFPKAYPVLQAFGPITNPQVSNLTTGERLMFTGSIASGDYWEIDLFHQKVRLNGSSVIRALDPGESTWFGIAQTDTEVQLAGSGFTSQTKVRALMRSAWA